MAVNVKLGVDIGAFTSGIKQGQQILKGLNAEMKASEAEFKATGNAEQKLASQTKTLNSQLNVQKSIAQQAQQALDRMAKAGVDPADASYQRLYATMMNAQAGANEAQAALNALGQGAGEAATQADKLTTGLNGISKKISLDQVISGIDKITGGLENAAKKAIQLGEKLWDNIMDSARMSDDILTQAGMLDMTPEKYQQYKGVFDTIGEVTISEWANVKRKVQKAINDPTTDQEGIFSLLGISMGLQGGKGSNVIERSAREWEDVFWQVATTLKNKVENGEISQDLADTYGDAIFGKKYSNLKNLIGLGQEGFEAALEEQAKVSDEALEKNAALNDTVIKLQNSFDALKMEVTSGLAPALTDAAKALDGLLLNVMAYLQTPEGKQALESLGTAVSGLFDDLGKIDPEKVVEGFTGVFNTVVDSVKWVVDNKDGVVAAMEGIIGGWALLKVTGGVLDIVKIVSGLGELTGAAAAGEAIGSAWAGGFSKAVLAVAPWIAGLVTLLTPSAGSDAIGNNTLTDKDGNLTREANEYGYQKDENGDLYQDRSAIVEAAAQAAWDLYRTGKFDSAAMDSLKESVLNEASFQNLMDQFWSARKAGGDNWKDMEDIDLTEWLQGLEPPKIEIDPEAPGDAAAELAAQIGTVTIETDPEAPGNAAAELAAQIGTVTVPVVYVPTNGETVTHLRTPSTIGHLPGFANGLPYVQEDNMLARLHKGERVLTASENKQYTYNNNTYFGSVNLHNGMQVEALAESIARQNMKQQKGYGAN